MPTRPVAGAVTLALVVGLVGVAVGWIVLDESGPGSGPGPGSAPDHSVTVEEPAAPPPAPPEPAEADGPAEPVAAVEPADPLRDAGAADSRTPAAGGRSEAADAPTIPEAATPRPAVKPEIPEPEPEPEPVDQGPPAFPPPLPEPVAAVATLPVEPLPPPVEKPDPMAEPVEPPPAKPPVPPPLPPLHAELERVRTGLGDLRCAAVRVAVADNVLSVSGTVTSEADRVHIVSLVDKGRDEVARQVDVVVAPRTLCEPLALVEGLQAANAVRAVPLAVTPAPANGRFHSGDALVLDLRTPDFDAHLYVDYFTADGMVVHLLPNPGEPAARQDGHGTRRLGGRGNGERFWTIGPPFGHELVIALASPTALFAAPRSEAEDAARYLADLRRALAEAPDAVADAVFLTTLPR